MPTCGKGEIKRVAYDRSSYTRKNGVMVSGTHVKAGCIKDRGAPGKGKKILPKLKKGTLKGYGYSSKETLEARHKALNKAVKALSYATIIRKLNAVKILNKKTNPEASKKFSQDIQWLENKH